MHTGLRRLGAFHLEMIEEELPVFFTLMEMMRGKDNRKNGHAARHLRLHQGVDNALRHEVVPVDAAIYDKGAGDDRGIFPAPRQHPRLQWYFERAGHIESFNFWRCGGEVG